MRSGLVTPAPMDPTSR